MKKGLDLLLCGNYPKRALEGFPNKDFALGVLWKVDGIKPAERAVRMILDSGKCKTVRIHLVWQDSHVFTEDDIPRTVKRAKEVAVLVNEYTDVQFYVSPWLENRASVKLLTKLFKIMRQTLPPRTKLVNSGDKMPETFGVLKEVHHSTSECKVFSFDGVDQREVNIENYKNSHKNAELFFAWIWPFNCKKDKNDHTPRPKRTLKPTVEQIRQAANAIK